MARGMTLNSLGDLASADIETSNLVEKIDPRDENIINNRVFVWNFEKDDLEELANYFRIYRNQQINADSRQLLSRRLNGKINTMLNEGYIPIECMLYASKITNSKLLNDLELIMIIAARIVDVYKRRTDASIEVLRHILDKWTWVPQLKIAITAVGLIGDNEELLDMIFQRFSIDEQLKLTVFYAFLQNKNASNLDRAMKIIMGLRQNVQLDEQIGRVFKNEFLKFGEVGTKALEKYRDNPGISTLGRKILTQIERKVGGPSEDFDKVAEASKTDNEAYMQFLYLCEERNDQQAAFLCRFSRADVVDDFLKNYLLNPNTKGYDLEIGLISLAFLKRTGYQGAKDLIREFKDRADCSDGYFIAMAIVGDTESTQKIVDILSQKPDYKLGKFFSLLKNANLKASGDTLIRLQQEMVARLHNLLRGGNNPSELATFTANLKILLDRGLSHLLSDICWKDINSALSDYSTNLIRLDDDVVISLISVANHHYNNFLERVLFTLYRGTKSEKIRSFIFQILKSRDIKAPM